MTSYLSLAENGLFSSILCKHDVIHKPKARNVVIRGPSHGHEEHVEKIRELWMCRL